MKETDRLQAARGTLSWRSLLMLFAGIGLLAAGLVSFFVLPGSPAASWTSGGPSGLKPVPMKIPAPDLRLSDLESQPVALADYTGQVQVVNNWATWCPPCKDEMPALQAYYDAHRRQGLLVIAIEAGDPAAEVVKFVQDYGLTFPVWLDPGQQAVMAFRNNHLPNTYVIDRSGTVRLAWTGAVNLDVLEKYVTPLLEEK